MTSPERAFLEALDVELFNNGAWNYVGCMCADNQAEALNFLKDLSAAAYSKGDPVNHTAGLFLQCVKDAVGVN